MKKSTKLLVLGVALAVIISVGVVFAADKTTTTASKPADKTAATTVVKVKLTQDDVTKIALKAHKDAKVVDVKLDKNVYVVKISTAKENRTLLIGGNTGKILKDTADVAAPVSTPASAAKVTPATKSK